MVFANGFLREKTVFSGSHPLELPVRAKIDAVVHNHLYKKGWTNASSGARAKLLELLQMQEADEALVGSF